MIHTIKNESLTVQIDSHGAQLLSVKDASGTEYIWCGDKKYWGGHAPVLFPIVGMVRGNKTVINGKEYEMKRHGTVRHQEWELVENTGDSLTLSVSSNEDTLKQYPFEYTVQAVFSLSGKSLKNSFTVINNGRSVMPYGFGGHPAFNVPFDFDKDLDFSDYVLEFEQPETLDTQFVNIEDGLIYPDKTQRVLTNEAVLNLKHELFAIDALVFEGYRSESLSLHSKNGTRGVKVSFPGFPYLGIWSSPNNGPFVCVEPWVTTATTGNEDDDFYSKRNLQLLKAGERKSHVFTITVL